MTALVYVLAAVLIGRLLWTTTAGDRIDFVLCVLCGAFWPLLYVVLAFVAVGDALRAARWRRETKR